MLKITRRKTAYNADKFEPPIRHPDEKHEFPKGLRGILLCKACGAVYYRKAWRHRINGNREKLLEKFPFKRTLCPADKMIKNHQFEGEIRIFNIPKKFITPLASIIKTFGKIAYNKNNQHRIIGIKNVKTRRHPTLQKIGPAHQVKYMSITATENQMTLQLAKKIKNAFKNKSFLKISLSPAPSDTDYISLTFSQ